MIQGADIPLYAQLKQQIREKIRSGELSPHTALPGERQLVETYGLSRTTVRQALNELVAEGWLYRRHGKGTYVAPPRLEQNLASLTGFAEELASRGVEPEIHVLSAGLREAPEHVCRALEIPGGSTVAVIQRVVAVELYPLFVDRTYLIEQIGRMVLGADLAREPIYTIIERLGYPIRDGVQTISAVALSTLDARLLQVKPGDPALLIRRITSVEPAQPVEYAEALYRADRYQYQMRLRRGSRA
ncbi:MAG TPA: GntR family transcriptional regulator [Limnochordia bacterium]